MSKIDVRDLQCENCRKFSHCNNNDLVCITKFQKLKVTINEIEEIVKDGDICCNDCRRLILNKIKEVKGNE